MLRFSHSTDVWWKQNAIGTWKASFLNTLQLFYCLSGHPRTSTATELGRLDFPSSGENSTPLPLLLKAFVTFQITIHPPKPQINIWVEINCLPLPILNSSTSSPSPSQNTPRSPSQYNWFPSSSVVSPLFWPAHHSVPYPHPFHCSLSPALFFFERVVHFHHFGLCSTKVSIYTAIYDHCDCFSHRRSHNHQIPLNFHCIPLSLPTICNGNLSPYNNTRLHPVERSLKQQRDLQCYR